MTRNVRRRAAALRLAAATLGLWAALGGACAAAATTVGNFSVGQLRADTPGSTGCGANGAGEPAIHVSRANDVFVGSESGLLGGSQLWRGLGTPGGPTASACALEYRGQPNVLLPGIGLAGGDIDIALASATSSPTTSTSCAPTTAAAPTPRSPRRSR